MFRYASDVSNLSHYIIKNFCRNFDVAVDATLGNGYDTDFLAEHFNKIYAFDIQKSAIDNYLIRENQRVKLIHDSHEYLKKYITEEIDCAIYNLGFLPGGDKSITTNTNSTLESLNVCINMLKPEGIITIAIYSGHEEGMKESTSVIEWAGNLPKNKYGAVFHSFMNRKNNPPSLIVVERK